VGDVIRAAMAKGMRVEGVVFQGGNCVDIGTPEDLARVTP
jgi:dTDP-glucose pyrophosphorylase